MLPWALAASSGAHFAYIRAAQVSFGIYGPHLRAVNSFLGHT